MKIDDAKKLLKIKKSEVLAPGDLIKKSAELRKVLKSPSKKGLGIKGLI